MAGKPVRVLVAIPAYNEADTVGMVIADVRRAVPNAAVLVVDDGSDDGTYEVAVRSGTPTLRLPFNVGVGGAMRAAFLYAIDEDFDAVVQVDADGQHDPNAIEELLAALSGASVVVGSRFAGKGDYRVRGPRRWAMVLLARRLSALTRTTLTDTTSGFRALDRAAVTLFARRYPAEYLGDTVESLVIASRAGLKLQQVPVAMRPRLGGKPSQTPGSAMLYLGRAMLALFVALHGRPRVD